MFHCATAFNQDIGGWSVAKVRTMRWAAAQPAGASCCLFACLMVLSFMVCVFVFGCFFIGLRCSYMFSDASAFNQPLENWETGSVTTVEHPTLLSQIG